jgi:cytochrome c5
MRVETRPQTIVVGTSTVMALLMAVILLSSCRTARVAGPSRADSALASVVARAEAAEIAELPEGPSKLLVAERCLMCHSAGLITRQRKDAAAWGRTVTQMRTWGTPIQDGDQAALVAYLTQHFGPRAAGR